MRWTALLGAALPGLALASLTASCLAASALAEEPAGWPVLERRFESTGGGGWIIDDYEPVRIGTLCRTDFTAIGPNGERVANVVEWQAVPMAGGVLCRDGRWRGRDGQSGGTTPLRVFLRDDGARFRAP
ncbi:hypothetical protein ACVFYP_20295 [Roseomonas sp. F4]